jgi:hypothetical protein
MVGTGTNGLTQTTTNFNISTNYTSSSIPQITTNSLMSQVTVVNNTPPPVTKTNYLYNIAVDIEYYPDSASSAKIIAKINKNAFYDQNWNLAGNGQLLSFAGTTNTDESGNIAAQLIQSAASIAELVAGIPTAPVTASRGTNNPPPGVSVPPAQIEVLFDPFNPKERAFAVSKLGLGGIKFNSDDFANLGITPSVPTNKTDGIFYRNLNSYQLELTDSQNNLITRTILLPDETSLYHVKLDKWPLVTSSVQATMNNGVLVGYSVEKPSQVEGGVELIPNTISTLISPATGLLSQLFTIKQESAAAANQSLAYSVSNALLTQELQAIQHSSNSTAP